MDETRQDQPKDHTMGPLVIFGVIALLVALALVYSPPYAVSLDDPGAVSFGASLNTTAVAQNQTVSVDMSASNRLPLANGLPTQESWGSLNLTMGPCREVYPLGIAVYQGKYALGNLSYATPVQIFSPGVYSCPTSTGGGSFKFAPLQEVTREVALSGYWTAADTSGIQGVLHPFIPGTYTVVVGDQWGHYNVRMCLASLNIFS